MTFLAQLEAGVDQGKVKVHVVRKALQDKDINTRGLAYALLAEAHLRAILVGFKPQADDPLLCFAYLRDSIRLDLDWDGDYAHTREDALYELPQVLDPYWAQKDVGMASEAFWADASDIMRGLTPEDVAVFLDGCEQDAAFDAAMADWAKDDVLAVYVPA